MNVCFFLVSGQLLEVSVGYHCKNDMSLELQGSVPQEVQVIRNTVKGLSRGRLKVLFIDACACIAYYDQKIV